MTTGELLTLESVLLGALEIRVETIITFEAGLPGFESLRAFALVETERDELVWLQSVDDPALTFLLCDPFVLVPGFEVDLPPSDLAALGASGQRESLLVLAVVQLDNGAPAAANLQSPIVIDRERRQARQVVLPDSRYGMQHAISVA
ncbi:MAG TPA: flagellar assembly protein FliW, partial [Gemmatimonadaceae bacterium]|nr:flagellar assembly protein FliW [Gemmatimonadaceae bacterium]